MQTQPIPCRALGLLGAVLTLVGGPLPAQERPTWTVDPVNGTVIWRQSTGAIRRREVVGGTPRQIRADLEARAVVVDDALARLLLVTPGGVCPVSLPTVATDAVPDGSGGAFAALPWVGTARSLLARVGAGQVTALFPLPARALLLRWLGDRLVVLFHDPGGLPRLQFVDGLTGELGPTHLVLPAVPGDLRFDDDGRLLLPGAVPGAIVVAERDLTVHAVVPGVAPIFDAVAIPGGFLTCSGSPPGLTGPTGPILVGPMGIGSFAVFSRVPGGVIASPSPASGGGWFVDRLARPVGWRPWSTGVGHDDGAGLEHVRAADLDGDTDGDGVRSREELRRGTDPGDAGSHLGRDA